MVKNDIQSILWKESGTVQALLWRQNIDLVSLVGPLLQLRFVSPIRNLLDHARSLQRYYASGVWALARDYLLSTRPVDVFRYLLKAQKSFFDFHQRAPTHFLYFFENEMRSLLLHDLARFLDVDEDPECEQIADKVMTSKFRYEPEAVDLFREIRRSEYGENAAFIHHMEKASMATGESRTAD